MHRFWLDSSCFSNQKAYLKDRFFHHILQVCRFQKGQKFILLSGDGYQYLVQLEKVTKKQATALIIKKTPLPKAKPPYIHLAISCPKYSVLESILKKGVELAVSDIHPFVSDWSFVRKVSSVSSNRIQRFQKIIQSSSAQSLRGKRMHLHPVVDFSTILKQYSQRRQTTAFVFYEGSGCSSLKKAFQTLHLSHLNEVWIFIGSEGGFSPREISIFTDHHIQPVTLGNQILKVETACLTVIGILKYTLGQL